MKWRLSNIYNSVICGLVIVGVFFLSLQHTKNDQQIFTIYSTKPLEPFIQEGVWVDAKAYSPKESVRYLQRDIVADGVQPVYIRIQNNTPRHFGLSVRGIPKPLKTPTAVSGQILIDAIPRAIAFKIVGVFFWPFLIPGAIDTALTYRAYAKLKKGLNAKAVKTNDEILLPYSTAHRVFFMLDQQLNEDFVIYLKDPETGRYALFPVHVA